MNAMTKILRQKNMNEPFVIFPVRDAMAQIMLETIMMTLEAMVMKLTLAVLRFLAISNRTSKTRERAAMAKRGM